MQTRDIRMISFAQLTPSMCFHPAIPEPTYAKAFLSGDGDDYTHPVTTTWD